MTGIAKRKINDTDVLLLPKLQRILFSMLEVLHDMLIGVAHAQPANLNPNTPSCTAIFGNGGATFANAGFNCIKEYISNLTFVVIAFAASISLLMLIINGYRYMVGPAIPGGSSDAAKKGIGAALTGLVLALLTYIILDTIVFNVTS